MFAALTMPTDPDSRQTTLTEIRKRALTATNRYLSDVQALRLAMAFATREPVMCASLTLSDSVVRQAKQFQDYIAITNDEFVTLFGTQAHLSDTTDVPSCCEDTLDVTIDELSIALRSTLAEKAAEEQWRCRARRVAVVTSLYLVDFEQILPNVLCPPLRSDSRRLEDLRDLMDERPFDAVEVNVAIDAVITAARL
tara:strand:- start:3753 stop:4340 length:588 start_codon:yes stop_codon:yes gene_type:complete